MKHSRFAHRRPSLPDLDPVDDDAALDPDWYPAALAPFAAPPSRWRVLRRPLGLLAGTTVLMALVLLVPPLTQEQPTGDDVSRVPAHVVTGVGAASPTVIATAGVGGASSLADSTRPTQRGGDNQYVKQGGDNQYVKPTAVNDPVLDWLPEILAAAEATGVPPALIAGMIRVESQGDPLATSPHGARGLMQVMPEHLMAQGVPEHLWHDPATNILAGARLLSWNIEVHGTHWDGVAHYFGIGCDGFNCTDAYVRDVLHWEAHYAELIVIPGSATSLAVSVARGSHDISDHE